VTRVGNITAADVGFLVDGLPIRSAPFVDCYGCLGTGRVRWNRFYPVPCSCVRHTPDCEHGGCVCPDDDWDWPERGV